MNALFNGASKYNLVSIKKVQRRKEKKKIEQEKKVRFVLDA